MARPIWNGMLSFGLLNVPIQLYSADKSVDLHFRLLDSRDKNPIRYERVNSETGEEVPWKEIVKAFEYSKGNYVILDPKELREAAPEATETIEIESFVPLHSIDPRYFEKPYYLVPGKKAEKGYVLLRDVLRKTKQAGIAKVVIRTRQYLSALFPADDALILNVIRFEQELVPLSDFSFPGAASKYRIAAKEIEMASKLIESMSADWNAPDYKDDFRVTLRKLVDTRIAKQGKKAIKHIETDEQPAHAATNVVDFMSLLKKSLASKERRERGARPAKSSRKKAANARE